MNLKRKPPQGRNNMWLKDIAYARGKTCCHASLQSLSPSCSLSGPLSLPPFRSTSLKRARSLCRSAAPFPLSPSPLPPPLLLFPVSRRGRCGGRRVVQHVPLGLIPELPPIYFPSRCPAVIMFLCPDLDNETVEGISSIHLVRPPLSTLQHARESRS